MKRIKALFVAFSVLIMLMISSTVAFASPEDGDMPVVETQQAQEEQQEYQEEEQQTEQQEEYIEEVTEDPYQEYYEENDENLPEVASEEVELATTLAIPKPDLSDSNLIGGVIAWLCVAVGIAVLTGVLVSKRTSNRR